MSESYRTGCHKVEPQVEGCGVDPVSLGGPWCPLAGAPGVLHRHQPRPRHGTGPVARARRRRDGAAPGDTKAGPSDEAVGQTVDRLRERLPASVLVGGPVAENHDLEAALAGKTPLVIGVVIRLGFLLLLVALQAPIIAAGRSVGEPPALIARTTERNARVSRTNVTAAPLYMSGTGPSSSPRKDGRRADQGAVARQRPWRQVSAITIDRSSRRGARAAQLPGDARWR